MIGINLFSYPNPVNEIAARLVAAAVAALTLLALLSGWLWLVIPIALGFWARVLTGPTLSPLARLAGWLAPRLARPRPVPGPPKRFAQGIGAAMTTLAVILLLAGTTIPVQVILAAMVLFAGLEAGVGLCVGCIAFNRLMRLGVIPPEVCEDCADISRRYA